MDSPVRQYLKQKDYRRHKLFRKIKRRKLALQEAEKEAPMRMLRKKLRLPKFDDGNDTYQSYATKEGMETVEFVPEENAKTNYHEAWLQGRQELLQENMNSGGFSGTAAEETKRQLSNLSGYKERYSNPNNPDDAIFYDYGIHSSILGLARPKRNSEGYKVPGEIVYSDLHKKSGVPDDIIVHERTHALNPEASFKSPQETKVGSILQDSYGNAASDYGAYRMLPKEVYAGLLQQRYQYNLSPQYKVRLEDIQQWRSGGSLNQYLMDKDDATLLRLFNEVAHNYNPRSNNVYSANRGIDRNYVLRIPTFDHGKSGIHIKPENRGKFTALKKRTGKSASWFKEHGTPALKKMATFAINSRKWKHK